MHPLSLTLNFPSADEAILFLTAGSKALERAGVTQTPGNVIQAADNPSVGAAPAGIPVVLAASAASAASTPGGVLAAPFNPFAKGAAAPADPTVPAAPSTAAAVAPPTVPAVPPATSVTPPAAAVPPAPPAGLPAAAPAAPAALTSPAGIELDIDGLPWDHRIHASGKDGHPKNADGRWRQKRGLNDPALKKRVEAELRAALAATPPAAVAPVAPVVPAPPTAPVAPVVPVVPTPPAAATPVAPPTAAPVPPSTTAPSPTVAAAPETFPSLMARISPRLASGALTDATLNAILAEVKLTSMAQLATVAPEVVDYVGKRIDQLVPAA